MSLNSLRLCLLFAVASGCASKSPTPVFTPEGTPAPARTGVRRDPNLITREELSDPAFQSQSVLEVVRQLRPKFLNDRSNAVINTNSDPEAGKVHASVDNGGVVGLETLASMHVAGVVEIRFLNAAQAMQRFGGTAREGPVIVVKTL